MLGNIGLYCVTILQEVEKLLLVLGLLASSLEIFLTSENCFLTFLGLQSLAIKYFGILHYASQIYCQNHIFFLNVKQHL